MVEFTAEGIHQFLFGRVRTAFCLLDVEVIKLLNAVRDSCASRIIELQPGNLLLRAQLGHGWNEMPTRIPFDHKRMKPLPCQTEGRLNARGTACLYMARSEHTAMSEVRPWKGEYISVGKFYTNRVLRLIDCTSREEGWYEAKTSDKAAWGDLNAAFAEPVMASDHAGDYIPTQILAEVFRREGYDGVQYRSSVDHCGTNVALLHPEDADCTEVSLRRTTDVTFHFGPSA